MTHRLIPVLLLAGASLFAHAALSPAYAEHGDREGGFRGGDFRGGGEFRRGGEFHDRGDFRRRDDDDRGFRPGFFRGGPPVYYRPAPFYAPPPPPIYYAPYGY